VAIEEVDDSSGDPVDTNNGESGVNKPESHPVIDPDVASTAKSILRTVVDSGTGTNANNGDDIWGKTGTTDNNGDAWFVGSTKDVTIAVWVGHADSLKPMLTEYNGGPVDGGTIPAELFSQILTAYDSIQEARGGGASKDSGSTTDTSATYTPTTTTSTPTATTAAPAAPTPEPAAPTGGGGGDAGAAPATGGGGTVSSGGGVSGAG
jgi:penicillin-binding protein 1A